MSLSPPALDCYGPSSRAIIHGGKKAKITRRFVNRATSLSLTVRRKFLILEYRTEAMSPTQRSPFDPNIIVVSDDWIRKLFQHMTKYDNDVSQRDVERWVKTHKWITAPSIMPPGMHAYWNLHTGKATPAGKASPVYPKPTRRTLKFSGNSFMPVSRSAGVSTGPASNRSIEDGFQSDLNSNESPGSLSGPYSPEQRQQQSSSGDCLAFNAHDGQYTPHNQDISNSNAFNNNILPGLSYTPMPHFENSSVYTGADAGGTLQSQVIPPIDSTNESTTGIFPDPLSSDIPNLDEPATTNVQQTATDMNNTGFRHPFYPYYQQPLYSYGVTANSTQSQYISATTEGAGSSQSQFLTPQNVASTSTAMPAGPNMDGTAQQPVGTNYTQAFGAGIRRPFYSYPPPPFNWHYTNPTTSENISAPTGAEVAGTSQSEVVSPQASTSTTFNFTLAHPLASSTPMDQTNQAQEPVDIPIPNNANNTQESGGGVAEQAQADTLLNNSDNSEKLTRYDSIFKELEGLSEACRKYPDLNDLLEDVSHMYRVVERNHKRHVIPMTHNEAFIDAVRRMKQEAAALVGRPFDTCAQNTTDNDTTGSEIDVGANEFDNIMQECNFPNCDLQVGDSDDEIFVGF